MNELKMLSPFVLFCQKVIPLAFDESMSYYECLCGLYAYLKDEVIPKINNNADAITEMQNYILKLKEYMDNYFENLDIQTEINNKLDQMAEDGELTALVLEYLELSGLIMFDTIVDLEGATNLIDGSFTKTSGRYTYNDGYGAFYKVRPLTSSDVIDGYNIVALTNYPTLICEKIIDNNLINLANNINNVNNKIGELSNLNTTDKSNIVNAINENKEYTTEQDTILSKKIGNLNNLNTTDKSNLVNAINENREYSDTKMNEFLGYKNQYYYYVDGVNGDDTNDGLTSSTAFKTIDKFFELLNKVSTDIRCHIISDGTYTLTKTQMLNANIHIVGDTNNITLNSNEDELVFYGGHINMKNITWDMPSNYFDNCLVSIENCKIIQSMRIYGGAINCSNTRINMIRLSWTKAVFDDITIDGQNKTNNVFHCDSSTELTIFNTLTISRLSNATSYGVIGAYRTTIYFIASVTNNSNSGDYNNGIVGNHMIIDSTSSNMTAIGNVGRSGNSLSHTLLFTNNQNLPV